MFIHFEHTHKRWFSISKIFFALLLSNTIVIFSFSLSLWRRKGVPNLAKSTNLPNEFALKFIAGHYSKVSNVISGASLVQRFKTSGDAAAGAIDFIPNKLEMKWTDPFSQSLSTKSSINDHSDEGDSAASNQHPRVDGTFGGHNSSGSTVRPMVVVACIREPPTRNATADQVDCELTVRSIRGLWRR
jgi:hypothetical protein